MLSGFVVSIGRSGQQHSLTTGNQFRKMKTICSTTAPTGEGSNGENAPVRKRRKRVTPSVKTRGHKTVVKAAAASPKVAEATEPKALAGSKPPVSKDAFSGKRFEDLALSLPLKKAILDGLGYVHTTEVQASSLPISLNGKDVLVKAKTGTGKTIAFLLPAIERLLRAGISKETQDIPILVLSPTRELAQQIAVEAKALTEFIPGFRTQVVCGGPKISRDISQLSRGLPTILVATPGRLIALLNEPGVNMATAFKGLRTLVLDEADRLLDMGFRRDLEKIIGYLPPVQKRQTALFSATMPADLNDITRIALRESYELIDCVGEDVNTHDRVPQSLTISPVEDQVALLVAILENSMKVKNHKIIVFFPTARMVQFYSEIFNEMQRPVLEIHSRKTQSYREKASRSFRDGTNVVMFSSDVTARGLDFPDVSTVIQVGLPADRDQYVHRLGRTARAGKGGTGHLLLADYERGFLRQIEDLPIVEVAAHNFRKEGADLEREITATCKKVSEKTKAMAYLSLLGYYNGNLKLLGWSKEQMVSEMNKWVTKVVLAAEVPKLEAKTAGKLGLRQTAGIRIEKNPMQNDRRNGGGRNRRQSF